MAARGLTDESDRQRIEVISVLRRPDRADNCADKAHKRDQDENGNADEHKYQDRGTNRIDEKRKVEVQDLARVYPNEIRPVAAYEVNDERKDEAEADNKGKMAENRQQPVAVVGGREWRGRLSQGRSVGPAGFEPATKGL